jgi:glyoxylase-like metal-dependent hydrolase (beta-lactamase superfamily II)
VTAEAAGIRRLAIPTPFAVGSVNLWLVEDDPLTLVDCGPNSGEALDELETGLRELGRRIEDLERIVLTHQHFDHVGLVGILARRSGAEVVALAELAPVLEDHRAAAERDDELAEAIMLRHGITADVVIALRSLSRAYRGWGGGAPVARRVADGGMLEFAGRRLEVQHRPGHSPSDTLLWDADRGVLIGGDHLLPHISSNPLIARPLGGRSGEPGPERPHALRMYVDSLRLTRELPVELVLPGHGDPFGGHAALIDERFAMHERRAAKIAGLLAAHPRTAHEIAHALWGTVAVTQAYLTLCEVLGHLDLLVERGQAREVEAAGVVRFEPVQSPCATSRSSS